MYNTFSLGLNKYLLNFILNIYNYLQQLQLLQQNIFKLAIIANKVGFQTKMFYGATLNI